MLEDFQIAAYIRTSFLDWTGHVTATVFTPGCNFACPWCNNGELVTAKLPCLDDEKILQDIRQRKDFLDGVCISGGEPTLQKALSKFLQEVKSMGLDAKLDTNGTHPDVLQFLVANRLVDFVAMDIKAPLNEVQYSALVGRKITQDTIEKIKSSIAIVKKIPHEFRTTYVPFLHTIDDLKEIRGELGDPSWVIQCFKPLSTLDKNLMTQPPAKSEDIAKYFPNVTVRG